jgi:hypothetical protein
MEGNLYTYIKVELKHDELNPEEMKRDQVKSDELKNDHNRNGDLITHREYMSG